MLWEVGNINIVAKKILGLGLCHCKSCHQLFDLRGDKMCDEPI
jgi:hypothetical protein